jgi:hypothetical protein
MSALRSVLKEHRYRAVIETLSKDEFAAFLRGDTKKA